MSENSDVQDHQVEPGRPAGMSPGDEVPPGTPGAGENLCPECGGSGRLESGEQCPTCGGTGRVVEAVSTGP